MEKKNTTKYCADEPFDQIGKYMPNNFEVMRYGYTKSVENWHLTKTMMTIIKQQKLRGRWCIYVCQREKEKKLGVVLFVLPCAVYFFQIMTESKIIINKEKSEYKFWESYYFAIIIDPSKWRKCYFIVAHHLFLMLFYNIT